MLTRFGTATVIRSLSPSLDHLQTRGESDVWASICAPDFAAETDFSMPLSLPSKEDDDVFFSLDVMSSMRGFLAPESSRGTGLDDADPAVAVAGTGASIPIRLNSSRGTWTVRGASFPFAEMLGVPIRRERKSDVCASTRCKPSSKPYGQWGCPL